MNNNTQTNSIFNRVVLAFIEDKVLNLSQRFIKKNRGEHLDVL